MIPLILAAACCADTVRGSVIRRKIEKAIAQCADHETNCVKRRRSMSYLALLTATLASY
jgi:hypothetical protein